jgi:Nucleotidyltransferase of unknown function (DUF6036)
MSNLPIDSQRASEFLSQLGACYRHPGSLYLVGGSSLILLDAKRSTLDIDLKIEVAPEHHAEFIQCLRQVSREMQASVELASPDEFLPLPDGYQDRRRYIGRFGSLEVFHFDFYSSALSKISRGNQKDYDDVYQMWQQKLIQIETLEQYFNEILPKVESFSLRASQADFQLKFNLIKKRISDS